ncbi:DUF3618 domain-containing protein [Micromonospora sp. NPDC050397]|uniref:DUF3618 domain-containing protein n=1 Tax=Micromonospora sp. NPDC050397 TaxID=3364279 RepID=UPI00384EDD55
MSMDPDQIRARIEDTQDDLSQNINALSDRVNPRRAARHQVDRARGTWQKLRENVMGSASHARDASMHARDVGQARLSDASSAASDRMQGIGHAAGDRVHDMGQRAQGHPLAAGLVAFGLGVLASSLLPPSEPERRAAGQLRNKASEHSGDLKQQAMGAARQAQDNLREPAQQAAESVKSKAGQSAGNLRDQAQSAGQDLRGQAQQKANDVRQR